MILPHLLVGAAVALPASAVPAAPQSESEDAVTAAHAAWNRAQGADWRLSRHTDLPTARHLWGLQAEAAFTPESDADWFELARVAFDRAHGMFRIADATLVAREVEYLDLWAIGTSDKVAVTFDQRVRGVPVVDASAHALFTPQGDLLGLDSRAMPGVQELPTRPAVRPYRAAAAAMDHFTASEGLPAVTVGQPALVILKHRAGKWLAPRLAWSVEVRNETEPGDPAALRVFVAADEPGAGVLETRPLIHHAAPQIQGHVESWATPGTRAHSASNPPALHPMPHMTLTSSAGNVDTDANGDFSFAAGSPVTFTARYTGPYCTVQNQAGANHSASLSFTPGTPATLTMNTGQTEYVTSEASCYDSVLDVRAWLKNADPSDTTLDFQVLANANIGSTCNAYYNGNSINMYRSGGGCNNTGFSTVVAHEEGHWANDRYNSGNGWDGFGEGNADVYGMYVYDTPIIGDDFFTTGGYIRTGNNTRQFCGDANSGCYGQVHADGEVLMGALWKVRDRLNQTLGNAAGDMTADVLHVAWMNAYDDGQIKTYIEEHWLALDDNDGNIYNGTPNFADIDGGFRDQGFPGVDLQLIDIQHVPLGDTQDEQGPYVVDAQISSLTGSTITGAEVVYEVDGGGPVTTPMTHVGGSSWRAGIPGQASPARLGYHIEAEDAAGNVERFPREGEIQFVVGIRTQIYFNDFEGATDEGWTHAQVATQDDWQRDTPQGKVQDPAGAYSGSKVWANDVGRTGWNGEYASNVHNWLESPSIDTTGYSGVHLQFARWLNVEESRYDQAEILIDGAVVWTNAFNGHHLESEWTTVDMDVSQWADNDNEVRVRFRLRSDGGLEYGGWNVDDFELYVLEPVPNTDTITLSGPTSASAGSQASYTMSGMPPSSPWWFLVSTSNAGTVFQGHSFDVGAPVTVLGTGTSDAGGNGAFAVSVPANAAGVTGYLEVAARNSAGAWLDSNPVALTIL